MTKTSKKTRATMKQHRYRKQSRRNQKGGVWRGFSQSQSSSPSQQTPSPLPPIKIPSSNSTITPEQSPYHLQSIKAVLDSLTKKVDKLADGITQMCGNKSHPSPNAPTFEELTTRAAELGVKANAETPNLRNITGVDSNTNALAARFKALNNMKRA